MMTEPSSPLSPDVDVFSKAINTQVMEVMGLKHPSFTTRLLSLLFHYPVHKISRILVDVDHTTSTRGWSAAAQEVVDRYLTSVRISGGETIPKTGPLLVVANHPAAFDFLVLSAALKRDDLKMLASDVPIVKMLPNLAQRFITVPYDIRLRLQTVRQVIQHLDSGGAVLTFPRGNVEPDPAVSPGAEQSLLGWSPSIELFLRRVPGTISVVAITSGMLSAGWYKNPVINLWKKYEQRQKVAEIFQVASQLFTGRKSRTIPTVYFSQPLTVEDLGGEAAPEGKMMEFLLDEARGLLHDHTHRQPVIAVS